MTNGGHVLAVFVGRVFGRATTRFFRTGFGTSQELRRLREQGDDESPSGVSHVYVGHHSLDSRWRNVQQFLSSSKA